MAEALLEAVLHNLNSLVQKELVSFWGIDREVEKLSSTVTAIQAVLEDAEQQQITNPAIKDWLRKLTDAAYVLDDILDACSIQSTRLGLEAEDSGSSNKVHSMSISSFNPKNILFRYNVSKRIRDIKERLDEIAQERQKFHLREGIRERGPEVAEWRQTSSIITQPQVYGREGDKERIVEFLVSHASDSGDLSIYPVVGIGGIGKTTLAQLVFNDERVSSHFDLKIWICVAEVFETRRIMQSIIESVLGPNSNTLDLDPMQKQVQGLLQGKRFLLVLDDVWNENQGKWEKLKYVLACGSKGASILVTTRLSNVASIMGTLPAHRLSGLSEDECWLLFKQRAFGSDREERADLVAIGKEIVRKCGGLPLAAKTMGGLMRFKFEEKEWLFVKESKLWNLSQDEDDVLPALRLSYFHLTLTLRRCFAFCAIYPKDTVMKKEDLILLWMANGLISAKGIMEAEDVGNEVWNELHCRSFFQDVEIDEFGNVRSFKMHDLVHDLAQSVMGEECLHLEDSRLTNSPRSIHYVSSDSRQVLNMTALKKSESLRTFLRGSIPFSDIFPEPSLRAWQSLRALCASGNISFRGNSIHLRESIPSADIYHEFPALHSLRALHASVNISSLGNLIHLRYLRLSNASIGLLPESICSLPKLQTLRLESCQCLRRLPKNLTRVQSLRHLMIRGCDSLSHMPPNIGKLTSLKTLGTFIVGSRTGHQLAELQFLNLAGVLHIRGLQNVASGLDAKYGNLIGKKDLNGLRLSWECNGKTELLSEQVLENLQPHSNVKRLEIEGYDGARLPTWMRNISVLRSLVCLRLYRCTNCLQLPPLGKLPHLRTLEITNMKNVKQIDDSSYDYLSETAFASLRTLTLHLLPVLETILRDQGVQMFPLLSELYLCGLPMFSLPILPSVKSLYVYGCNEELLKSISSFGDLTFLELEDNADTIGIEQGNEGTLANLCHLKTLHICRFAKLQVLPRGLVNLSALEKLEISCCHELVYFPEQVLEGLRSLRTLRVRDCEKFRSLSEGIQHLTSLEQLEIKACPELVALPNGINQLTCLRTMSIIGDYLNCLIPEGLERIPSLHSLIIGNFSNLTSLPECLGELTSLRCLGISDCPQLISLSDSIQRLTNLQQLTISWCPELEKRCKEGTGTEWHKIARVSQVIVPPTESRSNRHKFL